MNHRNLFKKVKPFSLVNGLIILILCFVTLYPLWFVIMASFSDGNAILMGEVSFFPIRATLANYEALFAYSVIPGAYLNTFLYVILGTLSSMFFSVLAAYPLSRSEFAIRKPMAFYVAFTMLFNGGMIPTYIVVQGLGLVDTIFALFLPIAVSPFNVIILRTFMMTLPEELIEAAKIDGCGYFRILVRMVLPCSLNGLITVLLFYIVGHWNSFMPGILYVIRNSNLLPMQNILRKIVIQEETVDPSGGMSLAKGIRYAAIVITVLPVLAVYPFLQKYFAKGLMIGSVKG